MALRGRRWQTRPRSEFLPHPQSGQGPGSIDQEVRGELVVAEAAGYGLLKDAAGIACIDNPGVGGMGVHYVQGDLVGDDKVIATKPEALAYEPRPDGGMRLVALEYVVFQAAWDAHHRKPPRLFGRTFELAGADNRYGLPPFYELHAWV